MTTSVQLRQATRLVASARQKNKAAYQRRGPSERGGRSEIKDHDDDQTKVHSAARRGLKTDHTLRSTGKRGPGEIIRRGNPDFSFQWNFLCTLS